MVLIIVTGYDLTDLDMYYAKLSNAYNTSSGSPDRNIDSKYPTDPDGFAKQRPEWEIVGAFASDPISISAIEAGSGGTPNNQVTVTTNVIMNFLQEHQLKLMVFHQQIIIFPQKFKVLIPLIQEFLLIFFQHLERIFQHQELHLELQ